MTREDDISLAFEAAFMKLGYNLANSGRFVGEWYERYDAAETRHAANGWEAASKKMRELCALIRHHDTKLMVYADALLVTNPSVPPSVLTDGGLEPLPALPTAPESA